MGADARCLRWEKGNHVPQRHCYRTWECKVLEKKRRHGLPGRRRDIRLRDPRDITRMSRRSPQRDFFHRLPKTKLWEGELCGVFWEAVVSPA